MLKKIITIGAMATVGAGALVGCSGQYQSIMDTEANEYAKYVDLADYKGIEVTKVDRSNENVSDEEVNETLDLLKADLIQYDEVEVSATGDTVTINATATIDGETFEEGNLSEYEYEIGSGLLIEGFDEGLTGKKVNEEFEIKAKFPDDYGDEKVNGKEAVFKTTLSSIKRPQDSEFNDEWVKKNSDELAKRGYQASTLDELKTVIRTQAAETSKSANDQQIASEAIETIIEKSIFKEYPEEETQTYINNIVKNVKDEYQNYGSEFNSFEAYLTDAYQLENEAALDDYAKEQAQEYMKNKMVVTLIAAENGIVVTDEEVNKLGDQMALYYGFDSFDKMKEEYGDEVKEDFTYQTLWQKVATYLASVSNPVKESAEEDSLIEGLENEENEEVNSEETQPGE